MSARVSLSTLRTLQRIRAAATDDAKWLAWKSAHPHVRTAAAAYVNEVDGRVWVSGLGALVLAGADAQRRATQARR